MVMFLLQSALLVAIAFLLGGIVGCLAHQYFGERSLAAAPATVAAAGKQQEVALPAQAPSVQSARVRDEPAPKEIVAASQPVAAAEPVVTPPGGRDDLKRIRGIGKQNEKRLNDAGVTRFAQIAGWTADDQKAWGEKLAFPGRIEREDWVGQARILAAGGETKSARRVKSGDAPGSG